MTPAETFDQDRGGSVAVEIREDVGQRFANDASAVCGDAVFPQRKACALQREELVARAVEGDLLLVALASTSRLRDMCTRIFIDKSL